MEVPPIFSTVSTVEVSRVALRKKVSSPAKKTRRTRFLERPQGGGIRNSKEAGRLRFSAQATRKVK
jgi:hypothetical protein